jgi:hypothetical protein
MLIGKPEAFRTGGGKAAPSNQNPNSKLESFIRNQNPLFDQLISNRVVSEFGVCAELHLI